MPSSDDSRVGEHGGVDLARGRVDLARQEFRRLGERAAQHEDERHDEAADDKGNAPAPGVDRLRRQRLVQREADERAHEHRRLLARRLERGDESPGRGRGDLGEIDGDAAELDARRKALQQPADDDDDRRGDADGRVGRRHGDDDGADRHDRQREDEALAATDPVDIGAEIDGAERAHQRADPEHDEGDGRVEEVVAGVEKRLTDRVRIEPEQEEIEHLQEIAAGRAQHGAKFRRRRRSIGIGDDNGHAASPDLAGMMLRDSFGKSRGPACARQARPRSAAGGEIPGAVVLSGFGC